MVCCLWTAAIVAVVIWLFCMTSELIYRIIHGKLEIDPKKLIVVITGCDSGFGELASHYLTKLGYNVISGCLTDDGVTRLKDTVASACICDVTKESDVVNLVIVTEELMKSKNLKLWCIVNNAGIASAGYLDWLSMKSYRKVMEVNYFGCISVIKHMLPLLKKTYNSRIINLSSVAGVSGCQMLSAYSASKHAVEGLAKCLRPELRGWGIHVSNVNPSFMKTPIVTGNRHLVVEEYERAPAEIQAQYPKSILTSMDPVVEKTQEDPMKVVHIIAEILTDRRPALWNYVGWGALFTRIFVMLPAPMQEAVMSLAQIGPHPEVVAKIQSER